MRASRAEKTAVDPRNPTPVSDKASRRRPDSLAIGRKRVLVADDDPELRQVIRQILESTGIEVHEASSGVDLLRRLANNTVVDLVVTDVQMPWASGEHVVQTARAAGFSMPVLIMTAFADDRLRNVVASIPGATLLEKPLDLRRLLEQIRTILCPS